MWLQQLPNGTSLHDVRLWVDGIGENERISGTAPTLTNITFATGKAGAIGINSVKDSSVYKTNTGGLGVGDRTYTIWVNPDSDQGTAPRMIYDTKADLRLSQATDFQFASDGATFISSGASTLTTGAWNFISVTRTADGTTNMYVDGALVGNADRDSGTPEAGTDTWIGSISSAIRSFNGILANIIVFKKILTADQIGQMYNKHKKA